MRILHRFFVGQLLFLLDNTIKDGWLHLIIAMRRRSLRLLEMFVCHYRGIGIFAGPCLISDYSITNDEYSAFGISRFHGYKKRVFSTEETLFLCYRLFIPSRYFSVLFTLSSTTSLLLLPFMLSLRSTPFTPFAFGVLS